MAPPTLRDSRRIPGLSVFHPGPGVVIDIACADRDRAGPGLDAQSGRKSGSRASSKV